MIDIPTNPAAHLLFDALAWVSGGLLGRVLYGWRLKGAVAEAAAKVGPGYFVSLGLGAVGGGYLAGSLVSLVGPTHR